jgi:hypothetical protein
MKLGHYLVVDGEWLGARPEPRASVCPQVKARLALASKGAPSGSRAA